MKIKKLAATALLAIAATGITAATASGAPLAAAPAVAGIDRGVAYTTSWAPDHSTLTTTLRSGRFALRSGAASVAVVAANGTAIAQLPTLYRQGDRQVRLTPQLDRTATTLTLRSVDRPVVASRADISGQLRNIDAGSTIAGVAIGCVVGGLIGIIFFGVGAVLGCVVGAIIGGVIGADR